MNKIRPFSQNNKRLTFSQWQKWAFKKMGSQLYNKQLSYETVNKPFSKMNNGINETFSTNMTSSHGIVFIFAGTFGHIKQPENNLKHVSNFFREININSII